MGFGIRLIWSYHAIESGILVVQVVDDAPPIEVEAQSDHQGQREQADRQCYD